MVKCVGGSNVRKCMMNNQNTFCLVSVTKCFVLSALTVSDHGSSIICVCVPYSG